MHFFTYHLDARLVGKVQLTTARAGMLAFIFLLLSFLLPVYTYANIENITDQIDHNKKEASAQIQGKLVPIGQNTLSTLEVKVFAPEDTTSTTTADGIFSLKVSTNEDSLKVQVDAPPSQKRTFHPVLFRASVSELERGVTVFMIPLKWTVQNGKYAGQTVEISIYEALSSPTTASPLYLGGYYFEDETSDFEANRYEARIQRWEPTDRPIPVAIRNKEPDTHDITKEDSTAFWETLGGVEDIFGKNLFRPATPEEVQWRNGEPVPEGVIGVKVDGQGCGGAAASRDNIVWSSPLSSSTGWENSNSDPKKYKAEGATIENGVIFTCFGILDDLQNKEDHAIETIQHEVMHTFGFGHGCLRSSKMSYSCTDGIQALRDSVINHSDIAYWELRNRLFSEVRKYKPSSSGKVHRARFALLPSLFGERKIMRGLDPIPNQKEWKNSAFKEIIKDGSVDFRNMGVRINFSGVEGRAMVRVSRLDRESRLPEVIGEKIVSRHRLVITSDRYPWSNTNFNFGSNTELRVDTSMLEGVSIPSSVTMYRRSWTDRASFEQVETNYDSASNEIVAKIDKFGEFVFVYPHSVTANVFRSFGDASGTEDYRLVALPGQVDRSLSEVINGEAGTDWQAYWDDGSKTDYLIEYDGSETFTFRKGNGFWLTATREWTFDGAIPTVELRGDSAATIPLRDGWNVISNPTSKDVAWSRVEDAASDTLQAIFGFDGSFTKADTFRSAKAGVAYYFFNDKSSRDSLVIPYPRASESSKAAPGSSREKTPMLALTAAPTNAESASGSTVRLGLREGAARGLGVEDLIAPPGRFSETSLRIEAPGRTKSKRTRFLMTERRPPAKANAGYTFQLRLTSQTESPITVSASHLNGVEGQEVALLLPSVGRAYDLREDSTATVAPSGKTTELEVVIGTEGYVENKTEEVLPEAVRLSSYPNPVRRQGTIAYALPERVKVTLRVYDVLGRRVATLASGPKGAGRHTVTLETSWLSSGVYFGRLQAGGQTRTQKIVVVR